MLRWLLATGLAATTALQPPAPVARPSAPPVREIAADTYLLPGAILPGRGPDGNTVILSARDGLVVVDTGRHPWHSDAILAFAAARARPITAIVNTHWHLDHTSGNGRLKAVHRGASVQTTPAVIAAVAPGGFLARNLEAARAAKVDGMTALQREERDLFIATMDTATMLRPDVAVTTSGRRDLAGRPLDVHVTDHAVTAADLWLYDPATRVAMLGDLVTLPAPFFETACPARWQAALDAVWATPFTLAVPGHGAPMTRADFDVWRQAFSAFRTCVAGTASPVECAAGWTTGVGTLLATAERDAAANFARYYVEFLRKGGGASPDCPATAR